MGSRRQRCHNASAARTAPSGGAHGGITPPALPQRQRCQKAVILGAAGLLLVIAGAGKVVDPSRTAGALAALGWPSSGQIVRLGAALELMLGGATLVVGGKVFAMLVAASYLGFSIFVMTALRLGKPIATCGCFAQADTPPSPVHVAVTSALALGAVVSASIGSDPLVESGWLTWVGAAALTAVVLALLTRRSA